MDRLTPGWRLWLSMLIMVLLGVTISVLVSVRVADRSIREQIKRDAEAREESRVKTCQVVGTILAAYEETPPPTVAGKNVASAWLDEYRILGCQPSK